MKGIDDPPHGLGLRCRTIHRQKQKTLCVLRNLGQRGLERTQLPALRLRIDHETHAHTGPRADYYNRMIKDSPIGRAGTPDEVGAIGALLMGPDGAFITGSDVLMDGGVTAAWFFGDLNRQQGA